MSAVGRHACCVTAIVTRCLPGEGKGHVQPEKHTRNKNKRRELVAGSVEAHTSRTLPTAERVNQLSFPPPPDRSACSVPAAFRQSAAHLVLRTEELPQLHSQHQLCCSGIHTAEQTNPHIVSQNGLTQESEHMVLDRKGPLALRDEAGSPDTNTKPPDKARRHTGKPKSQYRTRVIGD
jgi:hypothetical protein